MVKLSGGEAAQYPILGAAGTVDGGTLDVARVVVGATVVVVGAGAVFGAPFDADVTTPNPTIAKRAAAATGPTHRGPPGSSAVWLWARSPNGFVSSSMISMTAVVSSGFIVATTRVQHHRCR